MRISLIKYNITIFKVIIILIMYALFIRTFIFEVGRVNGRSMENTFMDDTFFVVDKFSLLVYEPKRGDIIQFRDTLSDKLVIKRIIGMPGEIIKIERTKVYLVKNNNTELLESYLKPNTETESFSKAAAQYAVIPENAYFVMGDNRKESLDSRSYGPVHRDHINGLVRSF